MEAADALAALAYFFGCGVAWALLPQPSRYDLGMVAFLAALAWPVSLPIAAGVVLTGYAKDSLTARRMRSQVPQVPTVRVVNTIPPSFESVDDVIRRNNDAIRKLIKKERAK